MRYQNQVVIITGGSRGIGAGCARVFAAAGATVMIASPERQAGSALAAELSAGPAGQAHFIECDVTSGDDRERLIAETLRRAGRVDCLINNAGWHPPHKPIDDFSVEEFRQLLELNVVSVFALSRAALPALRQTRGNIINISSLVAQMGQLHAVTYVATKGAITAFTKALAIDEAIHGVRVNSVSPGNIYTPLWQEAIEAAPDPAQCRAEGEAAQPLGRMGTPEEVGRLCLFLAADATFITGADHLITAGAELGYGRKSRRPTPNS
ncbi:MAG TPA: SDR family oxidoreductase [Blastocatellia bacterium]|nr:SDR family oxidoreductase [Blastocatellia bacterium]